MEIHGNRDRVASGRRDARVVSNHTRLAFPDELLLVVLVDVFTVLASVLPVLDVPTDLISLPSTLIPLPELKDPDTASSSPDFKWPGETRTSRTVTLTEYLLNR